MSSFIQGISTIKVGLDPGSLVDVSDSVEAFTLKRTYETVEIPAPMSTGRRTAHAGNHMDEVTVRYMDDGTASGTTLAGLIYQAGWAATPASDLYFEFIQDSTTAVGANNKRFTGSMVAYEFPIGGEVNQVRSREVTVTVNTLTASNS